MPSLNIDHKLRNICIAFMDYNSHRQIKWKPSADVTVSKCVEGMYM